MPLLPFDLPHVPAPLPAAVATFLADAQRRIDAWFARPEHRAGIGFIPCEPLPVFAALAALRAQDPGARTLLEWGSGFGVVTGLAATLGFTAHGIEIAADLVTEAERLLADHRLRATFAVGSFVPDDYDAERDSDFETRTVLGQPAAYDELGRDLDDFDVVFAYPWPTEEELYCDLFRRRANPGAVLVTWSRQEGVRAYRKVAGRRR